jgi:gliding motility-associated-like protein
LAGGAQTYNWSPATALSCSNCANPVASPTTTTTYTVTGTDANGCSNTDNVTVNLHPQPVIDAGADVTVCSGQAIPLQATGGVSYIWSPGTSLSCTTCPNPLASPANNITYSVVGTDINGCRDSDQVFVTVIQMLPFTIGSGDTLCEGESTQLYVAGGDQYLWIPSTGLSSSTVNNPTATPSTTTTYTVIIKQGSCFADTSKITVVVNPQPTVNAGADEFILAGSSVRLFANATHTTQYNWTPAGELNCADCQSPIATPNKTTTFTVEASNQYGCRAEDDVTIHVSCDNSLIFMANTFTPNGDGNNDRFYPQGKGISTIQRFRVYDRWGGLVFDAQNITPNNELQGWDGTYKGESLKPDVFVYLLEATCATGEPMQIKGDISLIR